MHKAPHDFYSIRFPIATNASYTWTATQQRLYRSRRASGEGGGDVSRFFVGADSIIFRQKSISAILCAQSSQWCPSCGLLIDRQMLDAARTGGGLIFALMAQERFVSRLMPGWLERNRTSQKRSRMLHPSRGLIFSSKLRTLSRFLYNDTIS